MTLAEEMYFREISAREDGEAKGREAGRAEGIEIGRTEGIEAGRAEGENRMNRLNEPLLSTDRFEDLKRSVEDPEYQARLFKEFGL